MDTPKVVERARPMHPALAVLIVDDEPQVAAELAEAIGEEGYPVEVVHSAADALERLRSMPDIAVMISDVRMPDCDGLQLTREALELRKDRDALEVILITGHASLEDAISAVRTGAFDFVRKPFRLQEIFDATSRAMARAAGRRGVMAGRREGVEGPDALSPGQEMRGISMSAKNLRGLMHELRNPLVPILGYAELLEQHGGGPDVPEKAREIIRAANLLVATVDNLLTLTLMEQGVRPPIIEDCDVLTMVRAAMAGMLDRATIKGVKLEVDAGAWRGLRADREHLERALGIVLLIAIELTPRFGTVTARIAQGGPNGLWVEGHWGRRTAVDAGDSALVDAMPDVEQVAPLSARLAAVLMTCQGGCLTLTRGQNFALRAELALAE